MATGPKIVHKQFNSPIGLYSQRNIQETLNKHLSNLDNGGVGIDFSNPSTDKPGNLAHSAVLRMLEEEERGRRNPGQKKVVWPPVPETNGYHQPQHQQQQSPAYHAQHSPSAPHSQYQSPPQPQYHNSPQYNEQYQQQPQYQRQPQHQQQSQPQYQQNQPAYCDGRRQEPTGLSKLIPFGPGVTASPAPAYRQGPQSPAAAPYKQPNTRWGPVSAPLSPQAYPQQQPQYSPQQYSQPQQQQPQHYQQQQYSQPEYPPQYSPPEYPPQYDYQPPQRQFEPPPATITLRQQPPVHQKPPPVFASQPATASYQGGVNMRGDQKWPPQSVREAVAAENEARLQLAKGPACRPRKVKKDYTGFFAQHALNQSYPGYRAPPGTQHYEDHSGRSSY
ncbi:activating signal cointegrator 1 complex subunit 2 homolog isoform X4 [Leguminivora glycinivorella]|uniref:activating signal cointegrator 1 complex subunit 2 homolog isoform X4 n=1 Tax=Leguminivora glycinivorella TaxID=1035111 RepID=UPI0020102DCB|nr:activating signal cointegrator 1 complex subunit 2 homolog isoform X4 [Leguminivora glycinivorella]